MFIHDSMQKILPLRYLWCSSLEIRKSHEEDGNITQEEALAYITVGLLDVLAEMLTHVFNC